jgi:hypothetical protein
MPGALSEIDLICSHAARRPAVGRNVLAQAMGAEGSRHDDDIATVDASWVCGNKGLFVTSAPKQKRGLGRWGGDILACGRRGGFDVTVEFGVFRRLLR